MSSCLIQIGSIAITLFDLRSSIFCSALFVYVSLLDKVTRDTYDIDDGDMPEDIGVESYHAALLEDNAESLNQHQNWIRSDIKGTFVEDE